jgi:hypothetical protein
MNKQLQDRVFDIPQNILIFLSQQKGGNGEMRNENLLNTKQVTYGQLKRILHDMKYMDKVNDLSRYNLYGGSLFENWGNTILNSERELIKNRKSSRKKSDMIGSITGERGNAFLSSHTKRDTGSPASALNMMKSNSDKSYVSSLGLTEQINRIKQLML